MVDHTLILRPRGFFALPQELRDRVHDDLKITVRLSKPKVEYSEEAITHLSKHSENFPTIAMERLVPHARLVSKQFKAEAEAQIQQSIVLAFPYCIPNVSSPSAGPATFLKIVTDLHVSVKTSCNVIYTGGPCQTWCTASLWLGNHRKCIETFVDSLSRMPESHLREVHLQLYLHWPEKDGERWRWPNPPHLPQEKQGWMAERIKDFKNIKFLKTMEVRKDHRLEEVHIDDNHELWVRWDRVNGWHAPSTTLEDKTFSADDLAEAVGKEESGLKIQEVGDEEEAEGGVQGGIQQASGFCIKH